MAKKSSKRSSSKKVIKKVMVNIKGKKNIESPITHKLPTTQKDSKLISNRQNMPETHKPTIITNKNEPLNDR